MKAAYFPHDYNARTDPKLQEVIMTHGMAGIGVYWCIVEMMYEQGGRLPIRLIKTIAFNLHTSEEVVESIIKDFELFDISEDEFYSRSAERRIGQIKEKSEKAKQSINARWEKEKTKKEQDEYERNTDVIRTNYGCNTNELQDEYERNTIKLNKNKRNIKEKDKKEKASSSLPLDGEIEDVKADNTWVDHICMNHHIIPAKLFTMLNDFKAECIANGIEKHRDIADVKSHINNWLRIQVNNKKKNKRNEDNTNKRRGLDVSDDADYSGEHF